MENGGSSAAAEVKAPVFCTWKIIPFPYFTKYQATSKQARLHATNKLYSEIYIYCSSVINKAPRGDLLAAEKRYAGSNRTHQSVDH